MKLFLAMAPITNPEYIAYSNTMFYISAAITAIIGLATFRFLIKLADKHIKSRNVRILAVALVGVVLLFFFLGLAFIGQNLLMRWFPTQADPYI